VNDENVPEDNRMWTAFKKMPILVRIFIVVVTLVVLVRIGTLGRGNHHSQYHPYSSANDENTSYTGGSSDEGRANNEGQADDRDQTGNRESNDSGAAQQLAQYESQQQQLMSRVYACEQQMQQASNAMARAAMNGQMAPPAQCQQYMPQWTAQEAFLETQIYRLKSGDYSSSLSTVTGIPIGQQQPSASRPARSSDGTEAVENWDRQAIRGNSLYDDESGQTHELQTQSYYFRDRSSGRVIASDSPNPPNDGHDYEQLTYRQPQY
jgi:cell division protein FtsB